MKFKDLINLRKLGILTFKTKHPLIILAALLFLLSIGALGTAGFLSQKKSNDDAIKPLLTQSQLDAQQTETSPPTYKNERYRFTVRYPRSWTVKEESSPYLIVGFQPPLSSQPSDFQPNYYPIFISVIDSKGQASVKDYYQHICDDDKACIATSDWYNAASEIEIAGTKGIKALEVPGPITSSIVSFMHGNYIVQITKHNDIVNKQSNDERNEALDLIIDSFRFF